MRNYNAVQDLKDNFENYKDAYDLNMHYINDNGGEDLTDEEKHVLIAGYLGNMHEKVSTISSNLCPLSKSIYEAQVYIDNIREHQEQIIEGCFKSDLNDILNDENMDANEKLDAIKDYVFQLRD